MATTPVAPLVCAAAIEQYARDRVSKAFEIALEEARPGYARISMAVREDMLNALGSGHGGITFALADTAFGYACSSRHGDTRAQSASITYTAPVRAGAVLTAIAEERHSSGRTGIYDVMVVDELEVTVAVFRGTAARIRRPEDG